MSLATLLAPPLLERLTQVLNEGQQAIMILNRKGYSPALVCRDCGLSAPTCETCGVPYRLFQRPSRLICLYCEQRFIKPQKPAHHAWETVFRFSGAGTQRLEEELSQTVPVTIMFSGLIAIK